MRPEIIHAVKSSLARVHMQGAYAGSPWRDAMCKQPTTDVESRLDVSIGTGDRGPLHLGHCIAPDPDPEPPPCRGASVFEPMPQPVAQ